MTCRAARETWVTLCSWCIRDGVVQDAPGASHGICDRHKDELLAPVRARRESSQPSAAPGDSR